MGHGKIEALNRKIRSSFLSELKASSINTLEELNEAFHAWLYHHHNNVVHRETGETPIERWNRGIANVRFISEDKLGEAFTWRENRKADKSGIVSLLGRRYQVGPNLSGKKVEIRYDPESLHEVEIWNNDHFVERAKPLKISDSRRPKQKENSVESKENSSVDYLNILLDQHRKTEKYSSPKEILMEQKYKQEESNKQIIELLSARLDKAVLDHAAILDFLAKYGPFDAELAQLTLDEMFALGERNDHHVSFYLEAIRRDFNKAILEGQS